MDTETNNDLIDTETNNDLMDTETIGVKVAHLSALDLVICTADDRQSHNLCAITIYCSTSAFDYFLQHHTFLMIFLCKKGFY